MAAVASGVLLGTLALIATADITLLALYISKR